MLATLSDILISWTSARVAHIAGGRSMQVFGASAARTSNVPKATLQRVPGPTGSGQEAPDRQIQFVIHTFTRRGAALSVDSSVPGSLAKAFAAGDDVIGTLPGELGRGVWRLQQEGFTAMDAARIYAFAKETNVVELSTEPADLVAISKLLPKTAEGDAVFRRLQQAFGAASGSR